MTPTDAELIARSIVGDDRNAFGELVRRHQSCVRNFLRQLTGGDAAQSDDLAQDTFVQAYRSLARYRGESRFATWLLGIARNQFRNARRRDFFRAEEPAPEELSDGGADPVRAVELRHDLASALRRLNPDERMALHLAYDQGLSHPEIAVVAGWPIGTVKTNIARGKEKLRKILAPWNPKA